MKVVANLIIIAFPLSIAICILLVLVIHLLFNLLIGNITKDLYLKSYNNGTVAFNYPSRYTINEVDPENIGTLAKLFIETDDPSYFARAITLSYLKDASFVNYCGQIACITYKNGKFVKQTSTENGPANVALEKWGKTAEGFTIFHGENGGSWALYEYYLIENPDTGRVAVFSFPKALRIKCKNILCQLRLIFVGADNEGNLQDTYFAKVYFEKDSIVRSIEFREL